MARLPGLRRCCVGVAAIVLLLRCGFALAAPDVSLQVTVNPEVAAIGQLIEIRVVATNLGATAATDVVVIDELPAAVATPAGMTHFASTGTYVPATGRWTISTLAPADSAFLTIPVTIVGPTQPPCIADVARATVPGDVIPANDRAVAAIRRAATDRCADVRVGNAWLDMEGCGTRSRTAYYLPVYNDGPDDATNVIVDMTQTPELAPGMEFTAAGCKDTRCVLPVLRPGTGTTLLAESNRYLNLTTQTVRFTASVSSAETDYATSNNQREEDLVVFAAPGCSSGDYDEYGVPLSGCFIATAAYGSPLEPHVRSLRRFRDDVLARSPIGRDFIAWYYRVSPPIAATVGRHPSLRAATRAVLTPVVFAVEHPRGAALGACALLLMALVLCARRRTARQTT